VPSETFVTLLNGGCAFCLHMKVGMVEGLLYGHKAGLDLNQVIEAVGKGAAGSWYAPSGTRTKTRQIQLT
jgi:3-hydroxyisobutyrate dehydrogenase-like beta-hydroxyacid dehydrogenase